MGRKQRSSGNYRLQILLGLLGLLILGTWQIYRYTDRMGARMPEIADVRPAEGQRPRVERESSAEVSSPTQSGDIEPADAQAKSVQDSPKDEMTPEHKAQLTPERKAALIRKLDSFTPIGPEAAVVQSMGDSQVAKVLTRCFLASVRKIEDPNVRPVCDDAGVEFVKDPVGGIKAVRGALESLTATQFAQERAVLVGAYSALPGNHSAGMELVRKDVATLAAKRDMDPDRIIEYHREVMGAVVKDPKEMQRLTEELLRAHPGYKLEQALRNHVQGHGVRIPYSGEAP